MSLILNIDTAVDIACVSIARNGEVIASLSNKEQKEHGGFLQPAIKQLLKNAAIPINNIDAVAVAAGPGSYTGLRIGMASAKGLCYALGKPLITVGSLNILTCTAIIETRNDPDQALYCPMIDARRMEVYTALYDKSLYPHITPCAILLEKDLFANNLLKNKIIFFGNGSPKWEKVCDSPNAVFRKVSANTLAMSKLSYAKFIINDTSDLVYSEPVYLKEFFG